MGSQPTSKDEFTVLVTGFQPFRAHYPVNPSWEIARGLPAYLPPLQGKNPNDRNAAPLPPVRILVHPDPIRVSYKAIRALNPSLWEDEYNGHKIDAVVHIGMTGPRLHYLLERRAHRTGYKSKDVDGEMLEDEKEGMHGEDWIWHGLPDEILSDFNISDVHRRWVGHSSPDMDLRISDDPGRYLCDFIYYSSLAECKKRQRPGKVVFFHVPANASDQAIVQGRDIAENLIRAIAESELAERSKQEVE